MSSYLPEHYAPQSELLRCDADATDTILSVLASAIQPRSTLRNLTVTLR